MSDDSERPNIEGFLGLPEGVELPEGMKRMVAAMSRDHDLMHMSMEQRRMAMYGFLDSLDVDQLLALRQILNLNNDGIQYTDGMAAAQLRLVHKVDPDSGETLLA